MSSNSEGSFWGIHGGRTGDAESLFLNKRRIGLGWMKVGDLAALKADREAFKAHLVATYPEKKPGAIPVDAGQLFRFIHEIKSGDYVAFPARIDRQIHFGRVIGPYAFDQQTEP